MARERACPTQLTPTAKAIITSSALTLLFPTPLVSVAEQIYLSALTLGFGAHDDAGMVRTYYTHPVSKVKEYFADEPERLESQSNTKLIIQLLKAIHLVAAAEAVAFAKELGIDEAQFYELCVDAAGGSVMFREKAPRMMEALGGKKIDGATSSEGDGQSIGEVVRELDSVIAAAQKVQSPLHLGSAARNLLLLAERRLGRGAGDWEIVRFWEGSKG